LTIARKKLIDLNATSYYHVISRCVRRSFLCGKDPYSGKCYEHRRAWIREQVKRLSQCFAIDVCAYAIMSNHYHLVLRVNREKAEAWTNIEVLERWGRLFRLPEQLKAFLRDGMLNDEEVCNLKEYVDIRRSRLYDVSWYMSRLNTQISRMANSEDECRGHFWESRFKSQALLDNTAVLTCMMYVDLNPIRAGIAKTLENSDFTSIQERIFELGKTIELAKNKLALSSQFGHSLHRSRQNQKRRKNSHCESHASNSGLLNFSGNEHNNSDFGLPFNLIDYFELIDWSSKVIKGGERVMASSMNQYFLRKLSINELAWIDTVGQLEKQFGVAVGSESDLECFTKKISTHWYRGRRASKHFYKPSAKKAA